MRKYFFIEKKVLYLSLLIGEIIVFYLSDIYNEVVIICLKIERFEYRKKMNYANFFSNKQLFFSFYICKRKQETPDKL